jgi:ATP-binding cassette, subfamily B, bacterial
MKEQNETTIPRSPLAFMWHVSRAHKKWLFLGVTAVSIAQAIGTSTPYLFRAIIDTAQNVSAGNADIKTVWMLVLAYPVVIAVMFVGWRISGFVGMEWASRANATAYTTLFSYLAHHSHTYFSNRFAGSLSSKISHASEGVQSLFEAFLWSYYSSILALIITTVFIFSTSVLAGALFLGLVLLLIPLNIFIARYRRPHVVDFSAQATRARGYAVDAITNISAVRQYARMEDEKQMFSEHIAEMRRLNVKQWRISEWGLLLNNAIIVLFEAAILYIAVSLWTKGTITVGEMVMLTTLMMNVQMTLVFIGMSINGFTRRYGEIQEGLNDILVPYDILDESGAKPLRVTEGKIECRDMTFEYDGVSVFEHFNLTIEPGQRIGLVGESGAGKSTFVSLLLRQHDLKSGAILIDGEDITRVTQDSIRENIALVPQESQLFHRSIKDNILYGRPEATDVEVEKVAKRAQAHAFISAFPEGYNTIVGERGVKLSGGQRQRVAIARAMIKDAPILILDEATSALDSESEVAIQKALHELMEGKTVIAIAHRLSTLREMDRIIVIENGKIIEDGTHEMLAKAGGTYARLWGHQAGGFLPD